MKTLFLLRHAKSDWPENTDDFDRPITDAGHTNAGRMADFCNKYASQIASIPEIILTSPAKRTVQTAQYFAKSLEINIMEEAKLYNASEKNFILTLENLTDSYHSIILVSHNNGISNFANTLSEEIIHFKTCGLAVFQWDVDTWAEAAHLPAQFLLYTEPSKL